MKIEPSASRRNAAHEAAQWREAFMESGFTREEAMDLLRAAVVGTASLTLEEDESE